MTNPEESTGATIATTTATSASSPTAAITSPVTESQPTPQQFVEIVQEEIQNSPTIKNELLLVPQLNNDSDDDKIQNNSIDNDDENNNAHEELNQNEELMAPLVKPLVDNTGSGGISPTTSDVTIRSRKKISHDLDDDDEDNENNKSNKHYRIMKQRHTDRVRQCCHHAAEIQRNVLRNTITVMNFLARVLFWVSLVALTIGVVWYSRELALHGTDPHLIAWFSAGAFVILGFPISIYAILMHLTNYYQPNVQCYVVRILWMVPIYSIESWLCLRFHHFAIYIETLRDLYESFVLYCFLQYLIEVLGGEKALTMMLKDKSPTRGFHYAPLNWCMKPWIMGQPMSRVIVPNNNNNGKPDGSREGRSGGGGGSDDSSDDHSIGDTVQWTSPFFVNCKFGCLQYVLLKLITTTCVMILEVHGLYKEGDFTPKGGYLYICILTNTSQCWALYCLVIFYYATKNELSPIRPVGKFLSVKALVFFTWWQSVGISILFQMGIIPSYTDWTAEDVAKGLQAYLICIEMFVFAILHTFVFPHTDYLKPVVVNNMVERDGFAMHARRLGRRGRANPFSSAKDDCSKSSDIPMSPSISSLIDNQNAITDRSGSHSLSPRKGKALVLSPRKVYNKTTVDDDCGDDTNKGNAANSVAEQSNDGATIESSEQEQPKTGFVRALFDSAVPRDVMDNTVGIARGDFSVEKKTLLHHAATSDQYALFAKRRKDLKVKQKGDIRRSADDNV